MKKILSVLLTMLYCILLTACVDKKNNFFIEGSFSATLDEITYYLNIENIDFEEYTSANGKNVVLDEVLRKRKESNYYFKIDFYILQNQEKTSFDFINLEDSNSKTSAEPIVYEGMNKNQISPYYNDFENISSLYYAIMYDQKYLYFERRI